MVVVPLLAVLALIAAVIALYRAYADHAYYKRQVQELQDQIRDAERLLRLRGNLAHEIAHEIKNPITAILCSAETLDLLIGSEIDEEHRKSLQYIKEYGDNLLGLVSDFLDVSMAESGDITVQPENVDLYTTAVSITGLLESNAIKKHITVKALCTDEGLLAYADPKHVKQVLFNLVHNAIKFTPDYGEIQVHVRGDFPNPNVKILVQDNGVGIPAEELPALFELYKRYEGNQPKFGSGLGLGLSLCRSLVELAGGTITVESTVGVGTCFEVTLPAAEISAAQPEVEEQLVRIVHSAEAAQITDPHPLLGKQFLIIDENQGSRESIANLLQAWGGEVDKVTQAVEAISALTKKRYDVVMIDQDIDGGYGCELARMIREAVPSSDTKIVMATSNARENSEAMQAAADKCIEKPLNGRVLLESLTKSGKYFVTH